MKCNQSQALFSSYLDGAVSGVEMHEVSEHLRDCATCRDEYRMLESTRVLVSSLGSRQAPPDLAFKIRIALSSERSHGWRQFLEGQMVRWQHGFRTFMLPATAGVVTAIFFFGALMGFLVAPPVSASADDVPTVLYTPPVLESPPPIIELNLDSPIMIETDVDASGRVQNYRVISGRDDAQIHEELNRALLMIVFTPAQSFGRPVPGKVVFSFVPHPRSKMKARPDSQAFQQLTLPLFVA
jgi:hypothetical protein